MKAASSMLKKVKILLLKSDNLKNCCTFGWMIKNNSGTYLVVLTFNASLKIRKL